MLAPVLNLPRCQHTTQKAMFLSLSGSLVLKDCQEDLAFILVVEYFLLNYHRLYVHCIIYREDRRQHARVGDFWEKLRSLGCVAGTLNTSLTFQSRRLCV